jgi:hypothetical protein
LIAPIVALGQRMCYAPGLARVFDGGETVTQCLKTPVLDEIEKASLTSGT